MNGLKKLLNFLNKLDEYGIVYSMEHNREDTLTVLVAVPGERWEVEFRSNGEIEVEVFYSGAEQDDLEGEEALERLFADYEEDLEDEEEDEDGDEEYDQEFELEDEEDEEEFEEEDEYEYEEDEEEDDKRR